MKRSAGLAAVCVLIVACGGIDRKKFDGVYESGKALQAEVQSSGGALTSPSRDRLKQFDAAINALQDHSVGTREADALQAYGDAAEAYRHFLRFRALDADEDGQIPVTGPSVEVAARFKLPVETRKGNKVVNRARAITILLQAAEQRLSDGNRAIGAQP